MDNDNLRKRVFEYLNEIATEYGLEKIKKDDAREIAKSMAEFEPEFIEGTAMWDVEKQMDNLLPYVQEWQRIPYGQEN